MRHPPISPIIGITAYARDGSPPTFSLPCGYVDCVRAGGATPLVLPPGEPAPEPLLDLLDGLLLAGGGDISPAAYGGRHHETIYSVCEERDAFEFALAREALRRGDVPMLCICRGLQVLNVVCGGTLHAHLPEQFGDHVDHRRPPRLQTHHPVYVEPESRLAGLLGNIHPSVCSWHHQAIDRVGDGLRAVAVAKDGVVEAVEHDTHDWCFGVQWHPEMQPEDAVQQRLFATLIEAARRRRRRRGR